MEDTFIITVNHKGLDRDFTCSLQVMGYTHKFRVMVGDQEFFFERDEEGAYRAVLPYDTDEKKRLALDIPLLRLIAARIESILA